MVFLIYLDNAATLSYIADSRVAIACEAQFVDERGVSMTLNMAWQRDGGISVSRILYHIAKPFVLQLSQLRWRS